MKVIQAGDLHLDQPFGSLPASLAERRRSEQMETFSNLLDLVRREDADALLLTGDVFERRTTRPETVRQVIASLASIDPVPVLIAPGNHDPLEEKGFWSWDMPPNVRLAGEDWERTEVGGLAFWLRGYTSRRGEENPLESFPGESAPFMLVLHADLLPSGRRSPYFPVHAEDFSRLGALHAALGHIHKPGEAAPGVWYAGSLEPIGFDEEGPHGALVVTWDGGRQARVRFQPLALRTYVTLEVPGGGVEAGEVPAVLEGATRGLEPDRTILRVHLTGQRRGSEAPPKTWEESLLKLGFVAQVEDLTHPAVRWEGDALSVGGRFVAAMTRRIEEAEDEDSFRCARQALADGLAALEGRKILDL